MKANYLTTACVAFVIFLMNSFTAKAQEPFYDMKWEDGRIVSSTKYVLGYNGLYKQESVSKYTYDENGDFLKKESYIWNPKYIWHDKAGWYPDYSENNWLPQYQILQKKDLASNMITLELRHWNKKDNAYEQTIEKMFYRLNDAHSRFYYFAFQKGDKFIEEVNEISYNDELLAGIDVNR